MPREGIKILVECDLGCINLHDIEIGWKDGAVGVACICLAAIDGSVFLPEGQVLGDNERVMVVFEEVCGDNGQPEYQVLESNMDKCLHPSHKVVIADIE